MKKFLFIIYLLVFVTLLSAQNVDDIKQQIATIQSQPDVYYFGIAKGKQRKETDQKALQKCYSGSGKNIKCNFNANGYRLPTEAEWEFAARGGNKGKGYKYSGSNDIGSVAWYDSNSGSKTHEVGTKKANELGIYDMSGNVWEWCNDWFDDGYYKDSPKSNPLGPDSGEYSVLRGGGWDGGDSGCRVANRDGGGRNSSYYDPGGFRTARTVE